MEAKNISYMAIPGLQKQVLTLEQIADVVCETLGITMDDLMSRQRNQVYNILPRTIFCVLARERTPASLIAIGNFLGRNHASVINMLKNHANYMETNWYLYVKMYLKCNAAI